MFYPVCERPDVYKVEVTRTFVRFMVDFLCMFYPVCERPAFPQPSLPSPLSLPLVGIVGIVLKAIQPTSQKNILSPPVRMHSFILTL